jgi:hypothetical protein
VPVLVLFVFFALIMVRLLGNQGKDALAIVLITERLPPRGFGAHTP